VNQSHGEFLVEVKIGVFKKICISIFILLYLKSSPISIIIK